MRVPLNTVAVALAVVFLTACTHLSPLRQNSAENPQNSVVAVNGYKVAFIEFGEQGSYQDPAQLKNALDLIQNTEKPLVITYLHGWQNNVESGDVENFKSLLARLNRAPAIGDVGFHVVGVYLGPAWQVNANSGPEGNQFLEPQGDSGAHR